jgi:hypothetical protein
MSVFISIAGGPGDTFKNTKDNDLLVYVADPGRILLGTAEGSNAGAVIGASNTFLTNNVNITGSTSINSNLYVGGGMTLDGGSLIVENFQPTPSNANVLISSLYGVPVLNFKQSSYAPFSIYQGLDGKAYINNSNSINLGTSLTLTNQGLLGIGTTTPRVKLDVRDGDINATNLIKLRKYNTSNLNIGININWTKTVSSPFYTILFETIQQFTTAQAQCTRIQKHKLFVATGQLVSFVSIATGASDVYSALDIKTLVSNNNNSIQIASISAASFSTGFLHEFDLNILLASDALGPVWLS